MKHMVKNRLSLIPRLVVTLFVISPFYIIVIHSVKSKPEMISSRLASPRVIHWDNFTRAIEISNFGLTMKNSLFITAVAVLVATLICTMSAYIITRKNNRSYNAVYYVFVGVMIIPFQSIMTPLHIDMTEWRLLNTFYGFITTKTSFQIASIMLPVSRSVRGIPRELEEAAAIDGVGIYSVFFRVVLPLMKPIILTSVVLNALNVWDDFRMSPTLLQKKIVYNVPLTQYFLFRENSIELGLAFALFILSMILILMPYLTLQKYIVGGITSGAIEG